MHMKHFPLFNIYLNILYSLKHCNICICFIIIIFLECEKMVTSKKRKTKSQKSNLSAAPFRLSNGDIQLADRRAIKVCVPVGHGWKPGPFFCKKHYLKSPDWKQV